MPRIQIPVDKRELLLCKAFVTDSLELTIFIQEGAKQTVRTEAVQLVSLSALHQALQNEIDGVSALAKNKEFEQECDQGANNAEELMDAINRLKKERFIFSGKDDEGLEESVAVVYVAELILNREICEEALTWYLNCGGKLKVVESYVFVWSVKPIAVIKSRPQSKGGADGSEAGG